MIFATVGTHQDGFPRLLEALVQLQGEELVVQYGHGEPPANATRAEAFLPFAQMAELFVEARVVITHAGVGSILLATRAGHVPIIVPRLKAQREHVDDHQVELARALQERGGVSVCWEVDRLAELVGRVPPRCSTAVPAPRPLATAVGAALRDRSPAPRTVRGRQGRAVRLAHDTVGAYFGIGTDFQAQRLGTRVDPTGLAGYHCDFAHKADPSEREAGGWLAEALAGRPWRSPMMVSQAALGFWERHLAGEAGAADAFAALADWLVRHGARDASGIGWRHQYPMAKYGLAAGWLSGMTQGEAISVLLRAHALTGDERYLETARAAFGPLTVDVEHGGVVREIDGALVIEEYPAAAPIAVLNGWIFGLLGLHELSLVVDDAEVAATLARTKAGLLELLPRYDVGWWSLYSLGRHGGRPDLAKPFYQRLHAVLLTAVDRVAPDPLLRDTARRWEAQITPAAMARIAADKLAFRARRAVHVSAG